MIDESASSGIWSAIPQIGTPIGLAAFAIAVVGWIWHSRLKVQQALVRSAPEQERAQLVETFLTDYRLKHDNLTNDHQSRASEFTACVSGDANAICVHFGRLGCRIAYCSRFGGHDS